jgi:hypothetical protein
MSAIADFVSHAPAGPTAGVLTLFVYSNDWESSNQKPAPQRQASRLDMFRCVYRWVPKKPAPLE